MSTNVPSGEHMQAIGAVPQPVTGQELMSKLRRFARSGVVGYAQQGLRTAVVAGGIVAGLAAGDAGAAKADQSLLSGAIGLITSAIQAEQQSGRFYDQTLPNRMDRYQRNPVTAIQDAERLARDPARGIVGILVPSAGQGIVNQVIGTVFGQDSNSARIGAQRIGSSTNRVLPVARPIRNSGLSNAVPAQNPTRDAQARPSTAPRTIATSAPAPSNRGFNALVDVPDHHPALQLGSKDGDVSVSEAARIFRTAYQELKAKRHNRAMMGGIAFFATRLTTLAVSGQAGQSFAAIDPKVASTAAKIIKTPDLTFPALSEQTRSDMKRIQPLLAEISSRHLTFNESPPSEKAKSRAAPLHADLGR